MPGFSSTFSSCCYQATGAGLVLHHHAASSRLPLFTTRASKP
jgi:hypothetical protein